MTQGMPPAAYNPRSKPDPTLSMSQHRGTLHVEEAEILAHEAHEGRQYILRLRAPRIAALARPGSFIHLSCGPELPMRRPFSIMRSGARAGWIDVLYRRFGRGTALLAQRQVGERLSAIGPIGRPFEAHAERPRTLLLGGGVGIPPMIFLAEELKANADWRPLVLMGSETPFPFRPRPSQIVLGGMPPAAIAAMPLLEDWGIPSRLASLQGFPVATKATSPISPGSGWKHWATGNAMKWKSSPAARTRCSPPPPRWRATSASRRRFRSRNTWPAPWAAAPAASCG